MWLCSAQLVFLLVLLNIEITWNCRHSIKVKVASYWGWGEGNSNIPLHISSCWAEKLPKSTFHFVCWVVVRIRKPWYRYTTSIAISYPKGTRAIPRVRGLS